MESRVRKVEVLKLPNGKSPLWHLRWWELTPDGAKWKEKCRSTKTTIKKEAEQQRRELERELDAGRRAQAEMTWDDFVKEFLDKHGLRKPQSTLSLYRHCLTKFGEVGKPKQLAKVNHAMLEDFANKRLKQEAAVASVNRDLRHLRAALRWAKRRGYISEVPDFKGVFIREDRKQPVIIPKDLSQNPGLLQSDVGKLEMDEGQVIVGFLFPTHKQAPRAVRRTRLSRGSVSVGSS